MHFLLWKCLHFCSNFYPNDFRRRRLRLISKLMVTQTAQKIIIIHILLSIISGSKINQAIKFRQLIEYDLRNIFIEKSSIKCCQEASRRPFYKNQYISGLSEMP